MSLDKVRNIEKVSVKFMNKKETKWDNVASWYDKYLEGGDTYQAKVIAPNLLRILSIKKGESVLDLACGQGYFSRLVKEQGASVLGVDLSSELINKAKQQNPDIDFVIANAENTKLKKDFFDKVFTVLAFENIKNIEETVGEIKRVLKNGGTFTLVMLHPAFRIPQYSDWNFDQKKDLQYRRVDKYLSEIKIDIELNPHKGNKKTSSTTFHRPLQWYMKIFKKHGFVMAGLEEWISHKKSQPGPKQKAEDTARKEFPMFLALEFKKL
jgi:ubiquinone/menaquinone biosynthesis C-methylase UbiE